MEKVQLQATLRRAEAEALHEMLNRQLGAIQHLERSHNQELPESIEREKQAIIQLLMAVESTLRATPSQ